MEEYERESFMPVIQESQQLNQKVTTLFKASNDIDADIVEVANNGDYDLLLVGVGQSIFEGSLLGKILGFTTRIINPDRLLNQVTGKGHLSDNSSFDERTRQILSKSNVPVGVLVDKGLEKIERVFIPIFSVKDIFLIKFAQKLINNASAQITILDAAGKIKQHPEIKESIRAIEQIAPNHIELLSERGIAKDMLHSKDLTLISIDSWKKSEDSKSLWLSELPSSLILTDGV